MLNEIVRLRIEDYTHKAQKNTENIAYYCPRQISLETESDPDDYLKRNPEAALFKSFSDDIKVASSLH